VRRTFLALACVTFLFGVAACSSNASDESTSNTTATSAAVPSLDGAGSGAQKKFADTPVCRALQRYSTAELGADKAISKPDEAAKEVALTALKNSATNVKEFAGDLTVPVDVRVTGLTRKVANEELSPEETAAFKESAAVIATFRKTTCRLAGT